MTKQRVQKAEFAAWTGIVGNVLLTLMKGTVGYMAGSKALIADAAHSASDVAGSVAVLVGLKAAKLPQNDDRPYKHGKSESAAAIVVSVFLLLVGIEIAISSAKAIYYGVKTPPAWYGLIAIIISIIAKEAMFQYKYRLGKKLGSQSLITSAWEHRSDVYSSLAAFAGIGGALLGQHFGIGYMVYLDPIAGLVISVMILKRGYTLLMETIHTTPDHVLHQEEAEELLKTVQRVKGVIAVDDLRAREHGHYVIVDVKISVNPRITVMEGHDIARMVKMTLMKRFIHVTDVFIHVNPYDPGYPYKNNADPEQDDVPHLLH
ncbi:cation diffusion facilitator family transporter [Paenibacillus hamazuiensis]|uniref:cation diffusion facilitator family transporter n=1 Tax=Paenibacillus hamazuiensis TaxID=2936508 RepID=UPI00200C9836|nr:cation diffusion facilitator family transporter [Paenibacillus hamazuiensis]